MQNIWTRKCIHGQVNFYGASSGTLLRTSTPLTLAKWRATPSQGQSQLLKPTHPAFRILIYFLSISLILVGNPIPSPDTDAAIKHGPTVHLALCLALSLPSSSHSLLPLPWPPSSFEHPQEKFRGMTWRRIQMLKRLSTDGPGLRQDILLSTLS